MPIAHITQIYNEGRPEQLWRLIDYCTVDAHLASELARMLRMMDNLTARGKVTYNTPEDVNNRGQQILVYSVELQHAKRGPFGGDVAQRSFGGSILNIRPKREPTRQTIFPEV